MPDPSSIDNVKTGLLQKDNLLGSGGFLSLNGFHGYERGSLSKWGGIAALLNNIPIGTLPTVNANDVAIDNRVSWMTYFGAIDRYVFIAPGLVATPTGVPAVFYLDPDTLLLTPVPTSVLILTAGEPSQSIVVSTFVLGGILYICKGSFANYAFDGLTLSTMGSNPALSVSFTSGPTATIAGAGVLSGTYKYRFTLHNYRDVESNMSQESSPVVATSNAINVAVSVALAEAYKTISLYRTTAGGEVFLFEKSVTLSPGSPGSTTNITSNSPDSSLGIEGPISENGVPPVAAMWLLFRGILFTANGEDDKLSFSGVNRVEQFDANDFRLLQTSDGGRITGISELSDTVVVFKNRSIWNVTGDSRESIGLVRQVDTVGNISIRGKGIVKIPGHDILVFPSVNGFYAYDRYRETYISSEIESTWRSLPFNRKRDIFGVAYEAKNQILWACSTVSAGSDTYDLLIIYDYIEKTWHTRSISAVEAVSLVILPEESGPDAVFIGGKDGSILRLDTGLSDVGVPTNSEFITRAYPRSNDITRTQKRFYGVSFAFDVAVGSTLDVSYAIDRPNGAFIQLGTLDLGVPSGTDTLLFNDVGERIFIKCVNNSIGHTVIIRGEPTVLYHELGRQVRG